MNQDVSYLTLADRKLAYQQRNAAPENTGKAGVIFLGGFASDMDGTKANFLDEKTTQAGQSYLRFDYRGHGLSSGKFEDGCIGDWADDTLKIFDHVTKGPQILVGSSMGGWIGLLLARARPERVAGFVGIAAAPDFTRELIIPSLTEAQKAALEETGMFFEEEALEGQCPPITQRLLDDGEDHLLLGDKIAFDKPVHLVQGQGDKEVPWQFSLRVADGLSGADVKVTLVKDADHRLSRPQDLDLIWGIIEQMAVKIDNVKIDKKGL